MPCIHLHLLIADLCYVHLLVWEYATKSSVFKAVSGPIATVRLYYCKMFCNLSSFSVIMHLLYIFDIFINLSFSPLNIGHYIICTVCSLIKKEHC